ncbi:hypothetical protein Mapa_011028 [Marchantia paleacea]|nr:hypothetical protein Mapa_011028 [Marchantia paleacea]
MFDYRSQLTFCFSPRPEQSSTGFRAFRIAFLSLVFSTHCLLSYLQFLSPLSSFPVFSSFFCVFLSPLSWLSCLPLCNMMRLLPSLDCSLQRGDGGLYLFYTFFFVFRLTSTVECVFLPGAILSSTDSFHHCTSRYSLTLFHVLYYDSHSLKPSRESLEAWSTT